MSLIKVSQKYLQTSVYKILNLDLSLVQLGASSLVASPLMSLLNPFGNNIQTKLSKKEMSKTKEDNTKGVIPSESVKKPKFDRKSVLSRQELLEVSQKISLYYAPRVSDYAKKLVLLSVDPEHLHAYWNLSDGREGAQPPVKQNNDLVLRIYSQEDNNGVVKSKPLIDLAVQGSQSKKNIHLPVSKKRKTYFARLGESNSEQGFIPLINSNNTGGFQRKEEMEGIYSVNCIVDTKNGFETVNINSKNKLSDPEKSHYAGTNHSGIGRGC